MNINTYINSLDFSNELPALNQLLSKAKASTSFFLKKRAITVVGYEGSASLDALAKKVLRPPRADLTNEERMAGIGIMRKLREFYHATGSTSKWIQLQTECARIFKRDSGISMWTRRDPSFRDF